MKYGIVASIGLLAFALAAQAMVTVTGFALLNGQQYHDGIHVIFEAVSPSAETDSVPTNSGGEYIGYLEPGVYNVIFRYAGFAAYRNPNVILLFDTVLDTVTLYPGLSGALSGTLNAGTYQVTDSIWVDSLQSLTIQAGTKLLFEPRVKFVVRGTLNAMGTETDSIVFTSRYAPRDSMWAGIRLRGAGSIGILAYCVVEKSHIIDEEGNYATGGGLLCDQGHLDLAHCWLQHNVALNMFGYGGGISFNHATGTLTECMISDNRSALFGGGIYSKWSTVTLTGCTIICDSAVYGGGLYCDGGNVQVSNSVISHNKMASQGCGIYCADSTILEIENCSISDNEGDMSGSGFYSTDSSPVLNDCIIARNIGEAGVQCDGGAPVFNRCTITGSHGWESSYSVDNVYLNRTTATLNSCIITYARGGAGVRFIQSENSRIIYSDIFGNGGGQFAEINDGPAAIGIIALTNANGDSCDTYYNVYRDPMFADTVNGNYHLMAGSPCIDAGDPALPHDADGTVADIGAYTFAQDVSVGSDFIVHPSSLILYQNYPNPFNAETRIAFDLPQAGKAAIDLFDITGRKIRTLVDGNLNAGRHEIAVDGSNLASGMYFCRMQAGSRTMTVKMMLLK
jgi:hypothetical protein